LVVEPLEEKLAEVPEIEHVTATARVGIAIVSVALRDDVYDTEGVWDEVEDKIALARDEFPDAVLKPTYNWRLITELESIVLTLTGTQDRLQLRRAAHDLKLQLLQLDGVERIELTADPGEQIVVEIRDAAARRLGLTADMIAAQVNSRTQTIPGGSLVTGGRTITVNPNSEFLDIAEIRTTPIALPSGAALQLRDIASIRYATQEPIRDVMRINGQQAIAIGIIPRKGINLVEFGERVNAFVARQDVAPLTLDTLTFQPQRVASRINELEHALLQGIGVVALVLIVAMGLRLGLVVALIIPLVAATSVALYAFSGGVLHQMSIAALVLSLGLLVDNGIVIAERIQWRIDRGEPNALAATETIRELAFPLFAATGTTIAAFLPLLLSVGPGGDFTRALPLLVTLTLAVSLVFAMTVAPTLAMWFFRPSRASQRTTQGPSRGIRLLSHVPSRAPWWVVLIALALVMASGSQWPKVKQQFFPSGDRNQLILEIELPEGAHLDETSKLAQTLEAALIKKDEVRSVASFIGRSTPAFYYTTPARK